MKHDSRSQVFYKPGAPASACHSLTHIERASQHIDATVERSGEGMHLLAIRVDHPHAKTVAADLQMSEAIDALRKGASSSDFHRARASTTAAGEHEARRKPADL